LRALSFFLFGSPLFRRRKQLDWIARRVVDEHLRAPGPLIKSLRKATPAARSAAAVDAVSGNSITSLFQPPGAGLRPSGIGLAADVCGPLSHRLNPRSSRATMTNAGPQRSLTTNPRCVV
jgi:hypothetical protein